MKSLNNFQSTLTTSHAINFAPQNGGVAQLLINYTNVHTYIDEDEKEVTAEYSRSKTIYGENDCQNAINAGLLNYEGIKCFKVLEVDYDIHPQKKIDLKQRGRATKWEWVVINSIDQYKAIIKVNKQLLK